MESINNLTQAASKYIYGDKPAEPVQANEEPVSGATGQGVKTDPYDGGNKDEESAVQTKQLSHEEPISGETGKSTKTEPFDTGNKAEEETVSSSNLIPKTTEPTNSSEPKETTDVPTISGEHNVDESHQSVQKPKSAEQPEDGPSAPEPSAPSEKPSEEKGEDLIKNRDPNDHSGEPLHVHDDKETPKPAEGETEGEGERKSDEQKRKEFEEKGTGEQWVKTSGVAADGGDFDATKPGAGREADRLLEQKGIRKGGESSDGPVSTGPGGEEGKKVSKTQKLKEKLHIGSSKHA